VYTIGSLCAFFCYLISSHQVVLFASTLGHIDLPELQALWMQSRVIVLYWVLLEPWFSAIQTFYFCKPGIVLAVCHS
jgi:hypothetical protein